MSLPTLDLRDSNLVARIADASLVISAGAGSGKTFTLVSLVLGFLGRGGRAPEVLATTFGREAASDLRTRILLPLDELASWSEGTWFQALNALREGFEAWERWVASKEPKIRQEISVAARLWLRPTGWPDWTAQPAAAREHWIRTRREAELLRTGTIHALALEILRHRGQEAGQLLEAEDPVLLRLLRTAGRAVLELPATDPDAHVARRLWAWCEGVQEGQDRWKLLASAFDAHLDALGSWRDSTDTTIPREGLFSGGQRLLAAYAPFAQNPILAAGRNKDQSVKAHFTKYGISKLQREPAPTSSMPLVMEALERLASRFLNANGELTKYYSDAFAEAMAPLSSELPAYSEAWVTLLLERVFQRFRVLKAERDLHSYGDLVREALVALGSRPEIHPPSLLLVDEYQDINPVQEAFLEALQAPQRILVGDPKQAIYGFRGGVPELLRKKLQEAAEHGQAFRLSANHRSCAAVVELSNTFVRDVVPSLDYGASDTGGEQTYEGKNVAALRVALAPIPSSKKQGGDLPAASSWIACLAQESGWCAAGFEAQSVSTSEPLPQINRRRALLLSRRTGLPALRRMLQAANIEPLVQSRDGFWESPGVRLMMALLETIAKPEARVPLFAVLRSPWVGATDHELMTYVLEGQAGAPSNILEGLLWVNELRTMSTQALVAFALARPGLLELLSATKAHGALEPARARRNLDHFLGGIPALPEVPSLAWSFLKQQRDARDPGDAPAEDTATDLIVQTIHGAKGLEYDDVILPMLADHVKGVPKGTVRHRPGHPGKLWIGWKLGQTDGPILRELKGEEERRTFREGLNLLYVGLTRAKERMAILQQWSIDSDGNAEAPPAAFSRRKEGKLVCWNHVATELSKAHADLKQLGDAPSLPYPEVTGTTTCLLPPAQASLASSQTNASEETSSSERQQKGIQIHALIREVLVRQMNDSIQARAYLSDHPLLRHFPEAKGMVEHLLEEMEARGWLHLPRRTELDLEGAGRNGGIGRADLVIWSPNRQRPEKLVVVDFKLSNSFSEEILAQHRHQLCAYCEALSRMNPGVSVEAWVAALIGGIWIQV